MTPIVIGTIPNKAIIEFGSDFKCRSCGTTWLRYIENMKRCGNSVLRDWRHDFDFGKPIRADSQEVSDDKVHDG